MSLRTTAPADMEREIMAINIRLALWRRFARAAVVTVFAVLIGGAQFCGAQRLGAKTFSSAAEASQALFLAVQNENEKGVEEVLGAGNQLASCGDEVEDKLERERFVQKYQQMHRMVRERDGTTILYIGAENWPFPVPLVSSNGAWHFDSQLGTKEVLFRRIGENETTAIQTSHALFQAEKQGETRPERDDPISRYAGNFVREENGEPTTQNNPSPFHGYYFRILTGQGRNALGGAKSHILDGRMTSGFAFVAYPADYRSSGVLTFIVDQNNVVYEKDLGPNTKKTAKAMTTYNPGRSWHAAE
jgi:hypothetical protein